MRAAGIVALWVLLSVPVAVTVALVIRATAAVDLPEQVERYLRTLGRTRLRLAGRRLRIVAVTTVLAVVAIAVLERVAHVPGRLVRVGIEHRSLFGPPPNRDDTPPVDDPGEAIDVADGADTTDDSDGSRITRRAGGVSPASPPRPWLVGEDLALTPGPEAPSSVDDVTGHDRRDGSTRDRDRDHHDGHDVDDEDETESDDPDAGIAHVEDGDADGTDDGGAVHDDDTDSGDGDSGDGDADDDETDADDDADADGTDDDETDADDGDADDADNETSPSGSQERGPGADRGREGEEPRSSPARPSDRTPRRGRP